MKLCYLRMALVLGLGTAASAQNVNFEKVDYQTHKSTDWWSTIDNGYRVTADSLLRHEGRYSLRIQPGGTRLNDKPLAQAPAKFVWRFKAEQDTAFQRGSGITLDNLNKQQIENLAVLGRVWGFVKYYHPAIARGDYNWDAELLRVLPKVLASKNQKARSEILGAWLATLGPIPACASCQEPAATIVRLQPDLAWLTDKKQVSPALSKQLVYLRQNRNQGDHYYVKSVQNVGNPIFQHEESYADLTTPDAGLRLLALYRYWNMIAYFFPYRYAIGEDWQQVLPDMIPQFAAAATAEQYRLTALKLVARIHDTHATVSSDNILSNYLGKYYAPVRIRFVEGQAVVTDYYKATLGKQSGLEIGDVVVQVDGVAVPELVKKWQPLAPASNEPTQLRIIANMLLRGNTKEVPLLVRRNDKEFALTINRYPAGGLNLALNGGTASPLLPSWRRLPNNIGYIFLGTIRNKLLPEIMDSLAHTKGLVIDIRNYPSENTVFTLSKYLLSEPVEFVQFSAPSVIYPGVFEKQPPVKLVPDGRVPYAGKVVILVNEITQSHAEYTTMAFRTTPGATVVGSTTAGADGNVSSIVLPGNVYTHITGLGVYYPDGRETQRVGIVPDVEVKPTIQGIKEGRDEVLEKAVQLIEKGN
ncbi:S41 family peptidase [Hymenobacter sp. YC55]|uniref:S41 family peptidase n=1 Tax=Hymenobacter sp. YC55 TaxID=3034019 RepID=UPI0023F89AD1|nr:S41 family peptidase [Hymenobacter sp. YC55]MDF7812366.1 S41 family peptidase [Hymenobacter sp. YC55]